MYVFEKDINRGIKLFQEFQWLYNRFILTENNYWY